MRKWLLGAAAWCLAAGAAQARDIYIDNVAGDDHNDGRYAEAKSGFGGPVRTLAKAMRLVRAGDRLVLAGTDVPYRESLSLSAARHCGSLRGPLIIDGQGAVLDGSAEIPPDAWEPAGGAVFRYHPRRITFQQIFLDGRPAQQVAADPTVREIPKLEPLEWCLHRGWLYFCVEQGKLPADYRPACSVLDVGITLYNVHDVAVTNLVVQGFRLDGINAHDGVRECVLAGVTCRGNGRSGVAVGGASRLEMHSSVVGDNGKAQVLSSGHSDTRIDDCDLLSQRAPAIVKAAGRVWLDGQVFEDR